MKRLLLSSHLDISPFPFLLGKKTNLCRSSNPSKISDQVQKALSMYVATFPLQGNTHLQEANIFNVKLNHNAYYLYIKFFAHNAIIKLTFYQQAIKYMLPNSTQLKYLQLVNF